MKNVDPIVGRLLFYFWTNIKGVSLATSLACLLLVTFQAFGQTPKVSQQQAYDIVKRNLTEQTKEEEWVYAMNEILPAKTTLAVGRKSIIGPEFASWFFFIDDIPFANWAHSCRYAFVDINTGAYSVITNNFPPNVLNKLKRLTAVNIEPGKLFTFKGNTVGCNSSARDYAVIISGGYDANNNHVRYWNDCAAIYSALVNVHGYQDSHIYVLMSDGTSSAADRHQYNGTIDSSPLDLDGDGDADIQYSATKANITSVFNTLQGILDPSDNLFIYTTDHGSQISGMSAELNLWNYETMTDAEFAVEVNKVKAGQIHIAMEQCYSGGFIDNLTKVGRTIATAASYNELSWAMPPSYVYDEFVYYWTAAIAGSYPNGTAANADTNLDGYVSMQEAFNFAQSHDAASETPQFNSQPASLATQSSINGIKGPDLWSQDTPEDLGYEANTLSSAFYVSNDIWVRKQNDGFVTKVHQNPEYRDPALGVSNYVYVRVRNRGCATSSSANVKLYWAKASSMLGWGSPWDGSVVSPALMGGSIGTQPTGTVTSGGEVILEFPWFPPKPTDYSSFGADSTHFCLLSRIETSSVAPYGMTFPEGSDLGANVRNNNNIAWKNITVVDEFTGGNAVAGVTVGNLTKSRAITRLTFNTSATERRNPFLNWGTITVDLGEKLYGKWVAGDRAGAGIKEVGKYTLRLTSTDAWIGNMVFDPNDLFTPKIRFTILKQPPFELGNFTLDLNQYFTVNTVNKLIGGERFSINTNGKAKARMAGESALADKLNAIALEASPNPSSHQTRITYTVPQAAFVELAVYNAQGVKIATLTQEYQAAGRRETTFDVHNLSPGSYFYQLSVNGVTQAKQFLVVK